SRSTATRSYGNALPIDENQSFFWQQTAQVWYHAAIATADSVLIDGRAHLLWQVDEQVRRIADAQFLDVCWTIRVHWIWADFFSCGNVRASDNDRFHLRHYVGCHLRRQNRLSEKLGSDQQTN